MDKVWWLCVCGLEGPFLCFWKLASFGIAFPLVEVVVDSCNLLLFKG